jgi:hypothetical protein
MYIKALTTPLHVSIIRSSSGSLHCAWLKLYIKMISKLRRYTNVVMRQHAYDSLFVLWGVLGSIYILLKVDFVSNLVFQGSLNFIIYFYFPILKALMIYISYCFISINNRLLLVKCYLSLVVSGFSRNEFKS